MAKTETPDRPKAEKVNFASVFLHPHARREVNDLLKCNFDEVTGLVTAGKPSKAVGLLMGNLLIVWAMSCATAANPDLDEFGGDEDDE